MEIAAVASSLLFCLFPNRLVDESDINPSSDHMLDLLFVGVDSDIIRSDVNAVSCQPRSDMYIAE